MRAAVYRGPGRISVESREVPQPGPTDVLVQVSACGLCGTDVHILDGQYPATPGIALGHEYAGVVMEVGSEVTGLRPGAAVAVDPNIACGSCPACRRGNVHLCDHLQALGVTRDGGFAEMCRLPASQAHRLPAGLEFGFVPKLRDSSRPGVGGLEGEQPDPGKVLEVLTPDLGP